MSFGTLHTEPNSHRLAKALIAAKYNGLELSITPDFQIEVTNRTPEFRAKLLLGAVPAFEKDTFRLFKSNAIAFYVENAKGDTRLLSKSKEHLAFIMQWTFFADNTLASAVHGWIFPIWGLAQFNKASHSKFVEDLKKGLTVLNSHLLTRTYLVGESVSLVDIICACQPLPTFKQALSSEHRESFKNIVRWFTTCVNQPQFKEDLGTVELATEEAKFTLSMKEEKKKETVSEGKDRG